MRTPPPPLACLWLGAVLIAGLVGALAALAWAISSGDAAWAALDDRLGDRLRRLAAGPIEAGLSWLSALHAPRGIVALTALASVALWRWHERTGVIVLLCSVLGGASINHLLKHSFQRPRPGLERIVSVTTDFSFPSGHAANGTLLYGTLAALVVLRTTTRPVRVGVTSAAALMVAGIACSRVVLGAHRVSDVVAGVLVGLIWMTVCLALRFAWRCRG